MSKDQVQVVEAEVIDDGGGRRSAQGFSGAYKPKKVSWSLLFSAALFIVLGIVCLVWPGLALETIALIIGIGMLVGGIGSIADFALSGAFRVFSGWLLASGIIETLVGLLFIGRPFMSVWVLSWLIAAAIIVVGAFQLIGALRMRSRGGKAWIVELVTGLLTVTLGILMFANPAMLVYWTSVFAIALGAGLAVLAFRVPKVLAAI